MAASYCKQLDEACTELGEPCNGTSNEPCAARADDTLNVELSELASAMRFADVYADAQNASVSATYDKLIAERFSFSCVSCQVAGLPNIVK